MVRFGIFPLLWILHPYYGFVTYAIPSISGVLSRDTTPPSSPLNTTTDLADVPLNSSEKFSPLVSASVQIKDSNGVDVTSSFQIKVFRQNASTPVINATVDNGLHDRQGLTAATAVRIIDECYSNETFIESHCTPSEDPEAALQAYVYICKKSVEYWSAFTNQYMGRRPAYKKRRGRCEPTELCVDGFGSRQIASCVHHSLFDDYTTDKKGQVKGMLDGEIFNVAKMYAVIANSDESVAIKARKMGIVTWDSASGGAKGTAQSKNCVNCVDLETDLLQPGMDSMKLEATLMSTGAVAGVLFLAALV